MTTEDVRDVLVVELLGGFGDLLLALPAVHALADAHPRARVRVLTFEPGAALLRQDPRVDEVVVCPSDAPGEARAAVRRALAARRPDLGVTTTRYDGIGDLVGTGSRRSVVDLWQGPPADQRVDDRFARLLADAGVVDLAAALRPARVHLTAAERRDGAARLDALVGDGRVPVLVLPHSGMAVKRWPASRWAALADRLHVAGHVAVVPEGDDRALAVRAAGRRGVVAPREDLRALAATAAAVAARGGAAVGGDTGPWRLAAAASCPVVGVFGPTLATRYGPHPDDGVGLQGLPGCTVRRPTAITEQECWWSGRCPLDATGPGCLHDVEVDRVADAVCAATARARVAS